MYLDGWLHRNVNDNDVLLLPTPEMQEPITRVCGYNLISDGGQAIQWRQLDHKPRTHHSGTPLYMSRELVNTWFHGKPVLHTVADDLESFLWVILCGLLSIRDERKSLTFDERSWLHELRTAGGPHKSDVIKSWTLSMLEENLISKDLSPILKVFVPFVTEILPVIKEDSLVESLTTLGDKLYKLWFKAFLDALPLLPKTWDEVFKDPI
ncbi:hypothetical protein SERLADRAFT_373737 [Serpula lacrymans var. lacrymans S7.9]|nr:uncharacterized protein SERLADRAFT_373737 [Serpula lacrymans var. lacrymans S7.9]EGO20337.1 hypothetical protein SERLADRAFT_373737 [Serpula lacrymans var. lacrymans S7.9]